MKRANAQREGVHLVDTHGDGSTVEGREVKADDDDDVRENEDRAFEVIALSFAVHVAGFRLAYVEPT